MDLKEAEALGPDFGAAPERHWYYGAKAVMMAHHLGPVASVLDVGAGLGFFSRWLLTRGMADRAVCVDTGYAADRTVTVNGRPLEFRRAITSTDADVALFMDILEHVDDDAGLLASYLDLLRPGARILITVPAFRTLWSAHDVYLQHRRRYTLRMLRRVVAAAGAREVAGHYYFGAILPAAAAVRLMRRGGEAGASDLKPAPGPVNALLSGICAAERRIMRHNRMAGLSVVMLCEKP